MTGKKDQPSSNMFYKMTLCTTSISIVQKVILTCKVVFRRLGACAKYGCLKLQIFVKIKDS